MKKEHSKSFVHKLFHIVLIILGLALIFVFIVYFNYGKIISLRVIGIFLWIISAILGWLPIYIFRKKAGVPKGKSFVKTTKIVATGIYSIVRHPQYLSGMLLAFSFMLISQHWLVIVLGIPFAAIFYVAALDEDKACLKKFGNEYKQYMGKTPRVNLILGIFRRLNK